MCVYVCVHLHSVSDFSLSNKCINNTNEVQECCISSFCSLHSSLPYPPLSPCSSPSLLPLLLFYSLEIFSHNPASLKDIRHLLSKASCPGARTQAQIFKSVKQGTRLLCPSPSCNLFLCMSLFLSYREREVSVKWCCVNILLN